MSFLILLAASAASAALVGPWAAKQNLSRGGHLVACAAGILIVLALMLFEAAITFDGRCYALDNTATPCTLIQHMTNTLDLSLTNGWPYVAAWLLIYITFQGRNPAQPKTSGRSES